MVTATSSFPFLGNIPGHKTSTTTSECLVRTRLFLFLFYAFARASAHYIRIPFCFSADQALSTSSASVARQTQSQSRSKRPFSRHGVDMGYSMVASLHVSLLTLGRSRWEQHNHQIYRPQYIHLVGSSCLFSQTFMTTSYVFCLPQALLLFSFLGVTPYLAGGWGVLIDSSEPKLSKDKQ